SVAPPFARLDRVGSQMDLQQASPFDSHKRFRGHSHKRVMGDHDKAAEILQGTLELLILRTLASGENHGYEVAEGIHTASAVLRDIDECARYPRLHRLERRGLLAAQWDVAANNRRAKYYRLTPNGRK